QLTATYRGRNIATIRRCPDVPWPNEAGHLFRDRGGLPEPRHAGTQVLHHDAGTAFGEKFGICPPQPAACPSNNRDLPRQRNSLSHLAIPFRSCVGGPRRAARQRLLDSTEASVPSFVGVSLVITTKRSRPAPSSSQTRPAASRSPSGHSAARSASTSSRTKQAARWSLTTPTACIIA